MPAVIQRRLPCGANINAASAPIPTSKIAVTGRPRHSTSAATAIALPHEDSIKRCVGPTTRVIHSQSTTSAPAPQNKANGQPPTYAASSAIGASTTADKMRKARLFEVTGTLSATSGSGLCDKSAEPAFTLTVFEDRRFERGPVEVRPIGWHEYQFAIGRLPEQEIRQPLLAAGADNQIGIGNIRRIEITADALHRHVRRCEAALRHVLGDAMRCARNFLTGAVIERHYQSETVIILRELFRLNQQPADIRFESLAFSDHAHAHIAFMQLSQIVADEAAQQAHQLADFVGGPRPVFRAEGKDGDELDADFAGRANGSAQRLDPAAMPFHARQSAGRRPTAVAIHDNGDVTRRLIERRRGVLRDLGLGHAACYLRR